MFNILTKCPSQIRLIAVTVNSLALQLTGKAFLECPACNGSVVVIIVAGNIAPIGVKGRESTHALRCAI